MLRQFIGNVIVVVVQSVLKAIVHRTKHFESVVCQLVRSSATVGDEVGVGLVVRA